MNQLMNALFLALGADQQEEEAKAVKAASSAVRAAQQRLTYEEFEALWNAIDGICRGSDLDSFTLGFRLGVQLMLEGLRPVGELSDGLPLLFPRGKSNQKGAQGVPP